MNSKIFWGGFYHINPILYIWNRGLYMILGRKNIFEVTNRPSKSRQICSFSKFPFLYEVKYQYCKTLNHHISEMRRFCGKIDNWCSFPIVQRCLINIAFAWHPLAKLVLVQTGQKTVKNTTYGKGSKMKSEKKFAKNFFLICCL